MGVYSQPPACLHSWQPCWAVPGIRYQRRNLYEKLRPFIGALGGLAFGVLGVLVGVGLRAAVNALLGAVG